MNVYLVHWKPPGLRSSSSLRSRKFFVPQESALSQHIKARDTKALELLGGPQSSLPPSPTPILPGFSLKLGLPSAAGGNSEVPDVRQHRKPLECIFFFFSFHNRAEEGLNTLPFPFRGCAVCFQSSASPDVRLPRVGWEMPQHRETLGAAGKVFPGCLQSLFPVCSGHLEAPALPSSVCVGFQESDCGAGFVGRAEF